MAGTRWVRINLDYLRNPKVREVSSQAVLLHLASILWTADQVKDGYLPGHILSDLAHMARMTTPAATKRADELVKAGLWDVNDAGWHVHGFDELNGHAMRSAVEAKRSAWRERQQRHRGVTP